MAADVGYLVTNKYLKKDDDHQMMTMRLRMTNEPAAATTTTLVTRDLLGESFSKTDELDLDLKVPAGWEKRLDLKSGKVYIQKCSSQKSHESIPKPHQIKRPHNIMEDTNLDLKLLSSESSPKNNSTIYQSVCTLDKVKSALDRAKNEQLRRTFFPKSSSKSPSSTSSTLTKVTLELESDESGDQTDSTAPVSHRHGLLSAAGCSNCLLYVMISKENPKCPKCNLNVTLPVMKKPRIDLNLNISI